MSAQTQYLPALVPDEKELNSYTIIARSAANTPFWQKLGGEQGILSIMLLARELGVSPMLAVSGGFNNIQGKIEISARLMNDLIRRRGHTMKAKICNDNICTLYGKRKDTDEEMEVSYTYEEAKVSGLIRQGSAWTKTPSDMLFWRCVSRLARRLFPDCIGSCYVEGELAETIEKKIVETVEVAPLSEFKDESIVFPIPEGIDANKVDEYLVLLSNRLTMSVEDIKKKALDNPQKFWETFKNWEQKQGHGDDKRSA